MATFTYKHAMDWNNPSMTAKVLTQELTVKDIFANADKCLILDTETTGLADEDRIIDIAIIDMQGNVIFNSLIDPVMDIPEKITEITGIKGRELVGQPFFSAVADQIIRILEGKLVLAWNSSFDQRMVENELKRFRKEAACKWDDAMSLYCRETGKSYRRFALRKAMAEQGVNHIQEHRALGDTLDTLAVLNALNARTQEDLFSGVNEVFDGLKSPEEKNPETMPQPKTQNKVTVIDLSSMEDEEL